MSSSNDDKDGERSSKAAKVETGFHTMYGVPENKIKNSQNLKGSLLLSWWHTFKSTNNMEIPNTQQNTFGLEM